MGLLTGSINLTRMKVPSTIDETAFTRLEFKDIDLASEVKESVGFLPFEPEAPYLISSGRLAFRLRIDRRRADAVQVRERTKQLQAVEMESTGAPFLYRPRPSRLRVL